MPQDMDILTKKADPSKSIECFVNPSTHLILIKQFLFRPNVPLVIARGRHLLAHTTTV